MKERLQSAYRLQLADLDVDAMPESLREDFVALRQMMTREKPLRGEDAIAATIRKLSCQEADQLAASLIEIFARMSASDAGEPARNGAVVNGASAQVIPLFAAEARP